MKLMTIADELAAEVDRLTFQAPVSSVYNPLRYARAPYAEYLHRFGRPPKEAVFLGMNPGPWGMAQTGIPFGEIESVRTWLGIEGEVGRPRHEHPKRPVLGFSCPRREVSGQRLWGLARERFKTPERFFERFLVLNYCPLLFLKADGGNLTPDQLKREDRDPLFAACDRGLRRSIEWLQVQKVIGVGSFAAQRAHQALADFGLAVIRISHPSPANPAANRNWPLTVLEQLAKQGIDF